MSNTVLKGLAVATAVTIGAVSLAPSSAEAGRRHHRHHGHGGAAVAAAILGFAAAAAITSRPSYGYYSEPAYTYAPPPPPRYYAPAYASYAPPIWSPEWYSYCHSKFRSFNPADGTYQPYHGPRRLCH